jgi:hypothetical protein
MWLKRYALSLLSPLLFSITTLPAQQTPVTGGVLVGAGGAFDFDRDSSDLFLHMGGSIDAALRERLALTANLGFVANVSDNDAFDDRSLLAEGGFRYLLERRGSWQPFLDGGYGFANGETDSHHFGFAGAGVRNWYGPNIGWQLEARSRLNGGATHLEVRLSVLLR